MLLENWRDFELENQDEESIKKVSNLMPKRVKKRRRIEQDEDAPGSLYFNLTSVVYFWVMLGRFGASG